MARNRCRSTGNTVKEMSLRMRQLRMPAGPGESLAGLFRSDLSTSLAAVSRGIHGRDNRHYTGRSVHDVHGGGVINVYAI